AEVSIMSVIEDYFHQKLDEAYEHPLLRFVDEAKEQDNVRVAIEVVRPRDVLGFKSPKLCLHFFDDAEHDVQPCQRVDWDDALNTALVKRRIRAVSIDNEKLRFALGLRAALQAPETQFGDGYYNGVLVHHLRHSGFATHPPVQEMLGYVHKNSIDPSFKTYAACREQIDAAIARRAHELVDSLDYSLPDAETILAAAIGQYLDERFSVTNRKMMGLVRLGECTIARMPTSLDGKSSK
ncbi:MAG: hypothetical protein ACREHD_29640, partial [Pirellulales bacterium]